LKLDLAKPLPGLRPTQNYLPETIFQEPLTTEPTKNFDWLKSQSKPNLSLTYPNSGTANLLVQRIQHQWKTNLQTEVKLEPMEWKAYLGKLAGDAPPIFFMGYSAPFPDAISHLKVFETGSEDNRSKFSSKKYDELLKVVRENSGKKREIAILKMHHLLVHGEQIVIPLVERTQVVPVAKNIRGFEINPFGVMNLSNMEKP
jgi:ABC-type transport system substrate-binding protein